jgi:primosomal protein N'
MANVPALGLIAVWDDGNSGYEERHAPYPHARTVAAMRAESEGAALLIGGFAQTAAARAPDIERALVRGECVSAMELLAERAVSLGRVLD